VLTVVGPDSIVFTVLLSLVESGVAKLSSVLTVVGLDTIVCAVQLSLVESGAMAGVMLDIGVELCADARLRSKETTKDHETSIVDIASSTKIAEHQNEIQLDCMSERR
jgi:hypothetical protein